jgi:hypothetical protein
MKALWMILVLGAFLAVGAVIARQSDPASEFRTIIAVSICIAIAVPTILALKTSSQDRQ